MLNLTEKLVLLGLISNVITVCAVWSLATDFREFMGRLGRGRGYGYPSREGAAWSFCRNIQRFINKMRKQ